MWLEKTTENLQELGYDVQSFTAFAKVSRLVSKGEKPNLAIMSLSQLGKQDRMLLATLVRAGLAVVALVPSLPVEALRRLWLLGPNDIQRKPYSVNELKVLVEDNLKTSFKEETVPELWAG